MRRRAALVMFVCLLSGAVSAAERVPLLDVAADQLPNDTAQDGATKLTIEDGHPQLKGKVLKVVYADGDTFGMARGASERNWKPFKSLEFTAFNPGQQDVSLTLAVRHKGTTSFQTRADVAVVLKPGRNDVAIAIAKLENINGSAPDLSDVQHWYLACAAGTTPTLYFSNIWLTGGPAAGAPRKTSLAKSDPARLARIKAAKMPAIKQVVQFNTPEADAILSALEVFPPDNAFNQIIEDWPLHPMSREIVASVGADKPFRANPDMGFVLVPPDFKRVDVKIVEYPGESDKGPFPIPNDIPIEGWPAFYQRSEEKPTPTLAQVQKRPAEYEGDRHAIVVDPTNRMLYEFFTFGRQPDGTWAAGQASVFDLKTNKLRPAGWTSTDAAGLPLFPAVVRYDELQRGLVEHALRVTVRRSRRAYVHPATHFASRLNDENLPRMGERFRLRADFDVAPFTPPVQAILKGLKRYGMLVADNGIEWAISITPDPRIPPLHEELRKIKGSDFEVVVAPE